MNLRLRTLVPALAMIAILAVTGCAKKPAPAPATPPPAPTIASTPTPVPTPPAPVPTPPSTPAVQESDLQPAFFDYDAATLREDARAALDADARLLRQNAALKIVIEGHCDDRGTIEYNQALGQQRAEVARDYLVGQGIDAGRLTVISYGKERPFARGADEASWQQNSRAHFRLVR